MVLFITRAVSPGPGTILALADHPLLLVRPPVVVRTCPEVAARPACLRWRFALPIQVSAPTIGIFPAKRGVHRG